MTLLFLSLILTAKAAGWPTPDFKNCEFYLNTEKVVNCVKNGSDYLPNYGFYYCNEFKRESKSWTKQAKKWGKTRDSVFKK